KEVSLMAQKPILEVNHLLTQFHSENGVVNAVNDVSFEIKEGQTVCLVGESGCGKSATALSIMGLIDPAAGEISGGEVRFQGKDILKMKKCDLRRTLGNDFSMIFQEPMSSLNPVLTIGEQLLEPLMEHKVITKKE